MKQEALNEFVTFMTETLKQAKDFTLEQAPMVCKEVIHWTIASNILCLLAGLIVLAATYPFYKFINRKIENQCSYDAWGIGHIFGTLPLIIFGAVTIFASVMEITKVVVAPRIFLIEYFTHLIK